MQKNVLTFISILVVFLFSFIVYIFFYGFFDRGDVRYPKDANYNGITFPSIYKVYRGNQLQYITYQRKILQGLIKRENDKYLNDYLYYLERHNKRYSKKDLKTIEAFLKDGVRLKNPLLYTSNIEAMKLFIQYYGKKIVNEKEPKLPIVQYYNNPKIINFLLQNGAKPHSSTKSYSSDTISLLEAYINTKVKRFWLPNIYLRSDQDFITKQAYAIIIRSKLLKESNFSANELEYLKKFITNQNYHYYDTFALRKDIRRVLVQMKEL